MSLVSPLQPSWPTSTDLSGFLFFSHATSILSQDAFLCSHRHRRSGLRGRSAAEGDEASAIADAFRAFVKVHLLLLDALIGKGGLVTTIPFVGPPVAAVLRSIESVVDVSYDCALFDVHYYDVELWN
jgi:hypothetical protein